MSDLKEGLYDQLITRRIRRSLDGLNSTNLRPSIARLEENNCPD